ncbi:MAG: hypothetical protein M3Q29_12085, partial [Chloroflexota bacterium]|nr:hypothetical protein [Chloroflexota bacterium]
LRLDEITPDKVRYWQRQKGSETNAHGRPHSPRSLQNMHGVLRMALNEALRDGLISANPVLRVPAPRGSAGKIRALSGDEMRLLLQQAASCPLYPLWVTLLATGLRVGEALALIGRTSTWSARRSPSTRPWPGSVGRWTRQPGGARPPGSPAR